MKHVNLVGVELEGGWDAPPPDVNLVEDISLRDFQGRYGNVFCVGEAVSPPLSLKEVLKWTERNYPHYTDVEDDTRGGEANCSLHIHLSTKTTLDYAKLMGKKFFTSFYEELQKWGKEKKIPKNHYFWTRASGKHRFCVGEHAASKQSVLTAKVNARRTMLNYCWAMHKTLECRVFPLFPQMDLSLSAIEWFVEFTEDWLRKEAKPEKGLALIKREQDLKALNTRAKRVFEF